MTRFARAKGSKSSNERLPLKATTWTEMKEQLEHKKKEAQEEKERQEINKVRNETYKEFLKEVKGKKESSTWVDFPEETGIISTKAKKMKSEEMDEQQTNNLKIKGKKKNKNGNKLGQNLNEANEEQINGRSLNIKGKKKQQNGDKIVQNLDEAKEEPINGRSLNIKGKKKQQNGDELEQNLNEAKEELINGRNPDIKGKKKNGGRMVQNLNEASEDTPINGKKKQQNGDKMVQNLNEASQETSINETNGEMEDNLNTDEQMNVKKPKKKKKKKGLEENSEIVIGMTPNIPIEQMSEAELKKFKKKMERRQRQVQKRKEIKAKIAAMKQGGSKVEEVAEPNGKVEPTIKKNKIGKQTKSVIHKKPLEEMTEEELMKVNRRKEKRLRQIEKRKEIKAKLAAETPPNNESPKKEPNKRKISKDVNNKEHKKRKPNSQVDKVTINGKEIELAYVEGFPIKKEDAERLKELRKQMIIKGLPKSEVKAALKLERRRAEKALSRDKKNVCFNCRKAGHVLSECPNLGNESVHTVASGICFKCGSTEHTHFECKVVKSPEFRFASCFICKEQGHIARQCPDNARGLYPKGGGCKLCGDVTHLKKDCPKFMEEQAGRSISLDTIGDDVEGLENRTTIPRLKKTVNKIVKF